MPLVASLVNKSLLVMTDPGRYRLLETVHAYAGRLLSERADEELTAREGHLRHFVALAKQIGPVFEGPELTKWVTELRGDLADIRDAIDWASQQGHADEALELAGSLWRFWWAGASGEGLEAIHTALSIEGGQPANRARALVAAVLAASARFDFISAVGFGQQAVAEADAGREIGPFERWLGAGWAGCWRHTIHKAPGPTLLRRSSSPAASAIPPCSLTPRTLWPTSTSTQATWETAWWLLQRSWS